MVINQFFCGRKYFSTCFLVITKFGEGKGIEKGKRFDCVARRPFTQCLRMRASALWDASATKMKGAFVWPEASCLAEQLIAYVPWRTKL